MHSPVSHVQQDHFWQRFGYVAYYKRFPLIRVQSGHNISVTRNFLSSCSHISSLSSMDVDVDVDVDETSDISKCLESLGRQDSSARRISGEEVLEINRSGYLESHAIEDVKETRRREKIGLANKGRVPWNKGKQHNEGNRI